MGIAVAISYRHPANAKKRTHETNYTSLSLSQRS